MSSVGGVGTAVGVLRPLAPAQTSNATRTLRLDLPRFTMVGATTRTGLLTTPLRDRFGVVQRLNYYTPDQLAAIVRRSAGLLGVEVDVAGAARSRGTPRIANRLLRRVRDVAQVRSHAVADGSVADEALSLLEVDALGLDDLDRQILRCLAVTFEGRPVGLGTLADAVGESREISQGCWSSSRPTAR